jgi:mannose-6-phosphate isomerase-like protein (cupin superfamily)
MIEQIRDGEKILAIVIPAAYSADGIRFFTPDDYSQQLAFIGHPAGKVIPPHVHNSVLREVTYTQEVLFVRKGKVRIDFYDDGRRFLRSRVLGAGDAILLVSGGHGLEVIEAAEMIEVKQGPYLGDRDKIRFEPGT